MSKVLLTSTDYIKAQTELTDNYDDTKLLPAIRKSQDIELQSALGSSLLSRLQELVQSGDILSEENKLYKELLDDYVQPYLSYLVLAELSFIGGQHLTNYGMAESMDENTQSMKLSDRMQVKEYYTNIANSYLSHLQRFIITNRVSFPELNQDDVLKIKANLTSSAETSIWLGGTRGRR